MGYRRRKRIKWRRMAWLTTTEGDEQEVKERKGLKNLTPNKQTRLAISLAQIKAGFSSSKLKNIIR